MAPTADDYSDLSVYQHAKRSEWGLAVLAWEHSNKRGYIFENGQLRVLAQAFFPMMREVERPTDEIRALHETLRPEVDAARADAGTATQPAKRKSTSPVSFEEQISRFRAAFPDGFADPGWVEQQRGGAVSRKAGAHRDASIAEAQKLLDVSVLEQKLSTQEHRAIYEGVLALLGSTDLVPPAELKMLGGAEPVVQRAVSIMTAELLHGTGDAGTRLDYFVTAFHTTFGYPPSWQLATALLGLFAPEECIVVRPTLFRTQAKRVVVGFSLPKLPRAAPYRKCLTMAESLRARLVEHGESPRDLLDVHDFMRETLRASAKRSTSK